MKFTIALNNPRHFKRLYRSGKTVVTPLVAVYYRSTGGPVNHLGITATKKIGNAVQRNRARRLIREAYRLLEESVPKPYDFVLVARQKTVYASMQQVKQCLETSFAKIPKKVPR